jgi:hypothetical protein
MADLVVRDNVVITQGDDRPVSWTLTDSTGSAVDLTGYTARAQVRVRPAAPEVLHEWSTEAGTITLTGSTVALSTADSETWTWTRGVYDVHLTDFSGRTEVVVRGSVVLVPGITR